MTTARVTHATPAALYAHTVDRNWESDVDMDAADNCSAKDIAAQLIDRPEIQVNFSIFIVCVSFIVLFNIRVHKTLVLIFYYVIFIELGAEISIKYL